MQAVRRWTGLAAAVTPVIVAATLVCGTPGALAAPSPTPVLAGTRSAPEPAQLTPAQVAAQIAAAERLRTRLSASSAAMSAASTRLSQLARQSGGLLARLGAARDAERAANAETATQQRRLKAIGVQVEAEKTKLGHWAHDSYVSGGGSLSNSRRHHADAHRALSRGQHRRPGRARLPRRRAGPRLRPPQGPAGRPARRHRQGGGRGQAGPDAAAAAVAAKAALDRSVAAQRAALQRYRSSQAEQVAKAGGVRGELLRSGSAAARAADKRLATALRAHGGAAGLKAGADCAPGDTRDYPNGRVPRRPCARCTAPATSGCARTRRGRSTR